MAESSDWYPKTRAGERGMYANIDLKINAFAAKYSFLTVPYLAEIHAACDTFVAAYDALIANRATGKQETAWFENLVSGEPQGEAAAAGSTYVAAVLLASS